MGVWSIEDFRGGLAVIRVQGIWGAVSALQ